MALGDLDLLEDLGQVAKIDGEAAGLVSSAAGRIGLDAAGAYVS
jgi:hypothetical protein